MVSAMSRRTGNRSPAAKALAAASNSRAVAKVGALPNMTMASCDASAVKARSLPSLSGARAAKGWERNSLSSGRMCEIESPGMAAQGANRRQAILNLSRMAGA
jgi:hypothetical protein